MRKPYNHYRKTLAYIGLITIFLVVPLLLAAAVYAVSQLGIVYYDRDIFLAALHDRG